MKKTLIIILSAMFAFSATAVAADFTETTTQAPKKDKKAKKEIKEVVFNVHIDCAGCVKKLQENLPFEKGVKDFHICMEDQIIAFKYDVSKTNEEVLKNAIEKLGTKVHGKNEHGHSHSH